MRLYDFFGLLSYCYLAIGVLILYRVVERWSSLWDDDLTSNDARLAGRAAFFLLIPPVVAAHELGHAAAIWAYGLEVVDRVFYGYMGAVARNASAGPLSDFVIAAAGNVVMLVVGVLALAIGLWRPGHPTRNILVLELGRQSVFITLVFYPLVCLGFDGDFRRIYDFDATPVASAVAAVSHALALLVGWGVVWRRRYKHEALLLCSPMAKELLAARGRVNTDDRDVEAHRQLGHLYLAAGDERRALIHLGRIVAAGAADASTKLAYGSALMVSGRSGDAVAHVESARETLLDPKERRAADLVLAKALTDSGRTDDAIALTERLRKERPQDDVMLGLWSQAMAKAGRKDEARATIEPLLDAASEERRPHLRRMFEQMR